MRKIQKIGLTAVLVAVILSGSLAGIVFAQENSGQNPRGAVAERVAAILNVDQQELEDAFKQARSELWEEALDNRLQELLADGVLSQDEADAYKAWVDARPDIPSVNPRMIQRMLEEGTVTTAQVEEYKAWVESKPDVSRIWPTRIERLVDEGIVTQSEADEYNAWMESRPDVPKVGPRAIRKLVEDGRVSQEEADAYRAWVEAKPDISKPGPEERQKLAGRIQDQKGVLTERVAVILNIDQQELENTFEQARSELQEEALDNRLQELVADDVITQDEAVEYRAWVKARPDVPRIWPRGLRR